MDQTAFNQNSNSLSKKKGNIFKQIPFFYELPHYVPFLLAFDFNWGNYPDACHMVCVSNRAA